jgi:hypothetical protein
MRSQTTSRRPRRRGLDSTLIPRVILYVAAAVCFALPLFSDDLGQPRNRISIYAGFLLIAIPSLLGWQPKAAPSER